MRERKRRKEKREKVNIEKKQILYDFFRTVRLICGEYG